MNKGEIDSLLKNYFDWLKNKTFSKEVENNWVAISTPFLDRHNDCLQIYAQKENEKIRLSDDRYTIGDLASCGCVLDSPHRKKLLETTLRGFGVFCEKDELFTFATSENFPEKKHNMIQAMLAVSDLFYTVSPHILSFFVEDVVTWFDSIDVRYIQKVKFQGKSGYDNMFDFAIPKSKNSPERILQTISNPTKASVQNIVFRWLDTKDNRSEESKLITLINDAEKQVSPQITEVFANYDIQQIVWSKHENYKDLLIA